MARLLLVLIEVALLMTSGRAMAVDETRARQLVESLQSSPNQSDALELLSLYREKGWQDLILLETCTETLHKYVFSLPPGRQQIRTDFYGVADGLMSELIKQKSARAVSAEEVVRLLGRRASTTSVEMILAADPSPEARVIAIEKLKNLLVDGDGPHDSILPGPRSERGRFREMWLNRPRYYAGFTKIAPEWRILGLIELMAELDSDATVRSAAGSVIMQWRQILQNKPNFDEDFNYVWDGIVEDYRDRTPTFVAALKDELRTQQRPIDRVDRRSDLERRVTTSIQDACQLAANLVDVNAIPPFLDVLRLPDFRHLGN